MKVRSSIKRFCDLCRILKRKNVVRVICLIKKHNQRQH